MADNRRDEDRRKRPDRRDAVDRRSGLNRRRGPGRRRGEIRKAAEEGEISGELLEFLMAIDEYKRVNERPFPSWTEVFELIQFLGYRKVANRAGHVNSPTDAQDGADVLASPGPEEERTA